MSDVFVFGSNLLGIHGKGAAKDALLYHGAIYGKGAGRQGKSYAIPTKATPYEPLPLEAIEVFVKEFLNHASEYYEESFFVTAVGCGLAGYKPEQIAPMFKDSPENVNLPKVFLDILKDV